MRARGIGRPADRIDLGEIDLSEIEWHRDAACRGIDIESRDPFFPDRGGSTKPAKLLCAHCPVRDECLADALENDAEFGIWGGLTSDERRRLKRQDRERQRRSA